MKRLFCIMLLTALTVNTFVSAQKSWTLEECIKIALENNIQIKRQQLNTQMQKKNLQQSKYDMLPSVSAGASHSVSFLNTINQTTNAYDKNIQQGNFNVQSSVVLFRGFQIQNTIKKNELSFMAGLADLEKAKNDVSLNVASAYLQVLFIQELLDVSKSQLDVTRLQVEKTKRFVEVGNVARGNLFEIQAQAAQEKVSVTNAENQLQTAYLDLVQLIDLDSIGNFRVVRPDSLKVPMAGIIMSLDTVYNGAVVKMPQIKSAEYTMKSYERDLAIAKGGLYPSLSASGGFSSHYQVNAHQLDDMKQQVPYSISNQLKDKRVGDV